MKIEIKNKTYFVKWQHNVVDNSTHKMSKRINPDPSTTRCNILIGPKTEEAKMTVVGFGISTLATTDTFNKDIGRRVSMTRALNVFSKEERAIFWDHYNKEVGPLKKSLSNTSGK